MSEPFGFFLTWTTYGSWLPGDARGWVKSGQWCIHAGDPDKEAQARRDLREEPVVLTADQRTLVEETIRDHCEYRGWGLHAVNVRTNHVHVVVSSDIRPDEVMKQLKAWCSRRLNAAYKRREWWTEDGSKRWLNTAESLARAVEYVSSYQ